MSHALRRAARGTQGGFSPLEVGWTHAYWAEGPEFAALGLSNGAAVATFPDEVGTLDATQSTAARKPTYSAAGGPNSKPTLTFDGGDGVSAASPAQAQPFTIVAIMSTTNPSGSSWYITAPSPLMIMRQNAGKWAIYNGFGPDGAPCDSNPHMQRGYFNAGSSVVATDEAVTTGSVSINSWTAFTIGAENGTAAPNGLSGAIAFVGIYNGNVTADAKWSDFKAYCLSHWNITVA